MKDYKIKLAKYSYQDRVNGYWNTLTVERINDWYEIRLNGSIVSSSLSFAKTNENVKALLNIVA